LIADETGGRAIVGTNDPAPVLRQMLVDTSGYYLLGYTSTEAPRDGKFHEITVRVKRKGIEVRARKGYWALSLDDVARADRPAAPGLPADMAEALSSAVVPASGRLLRTCVGFDRADGGQSAVSIVWEAAGDRSTSDVVHQARVIVSASNGDPVFSGRSVKEPSMVSAGGRVTFITRPGPIHLRVSAEDATGRSLDSEERDVFVPDFTKVGPVVTIPEILRARTAGELTRIRESTTALPTASHQFIRSDLLLLRFRAYAQGGGTPDVAVRLLDAQGATISTLPPPRRRTDGQLETMLLPASLAPATYLIQIEASYGHDNARVLWGFTIREH
jgi:hypothetical protein